MKQYKELLQTILDKGYKCEPAARQDVGTIQINSYEFKHDLREGFPLLTTKKVSFKNIVVELLWFLHGDTNIKYLVDNGCNVWNSDAYKFYLRVFGKNSVKYSLEFDEFIDCIKTNEDLQLWSDNNYKLGDLGPVYGKQWRKRTQAYELHYVEEGIGYDRYEVEYIDQISNLIKDIREAVKTGNNNRRLIVDAWNPGEISQMALPPCHYGFQVVLEPINIEERKRLGGLSNTKGISEDIKPLMLNNQNLIEQVREQLARKERDLPTLYFAKEAEELIQATARGLNDIDDFMRYIKPEHFGVSDYNPHPAIKGEIVT
jgi:thymidylate synthase